MGQAWVPVALPLGGSPAEPEQDQAAEEASATVHLLMRLYDATELAEREREVTSRTAAGFAANAATVRTAEDLMAIVDEVDKVKARDLQDILERTSDWRGVAGDDDAAMEFSAERLEALLRYEFVFRRVRHAFFAFSREGVAKN
ncbi:hypothetical protein DYQ93_11450 [Xanthomonas sp. LMG 8992]|nr:hypothetical protein [Xanthomonas sp. LMG 8992]